LLVCFLALSQRADWAEHKQYCSGDWPKRLPNLPRECEEKVLSADVEDADCTHVEHYPWYVIVLGVTVFALVAWLITRFVGAHYVAALVVCYVVYCNLLPEGEE
jgi:hypothetical protein